MIQAARTMLEGMGVERNHIAFDEFWVSIEFTKLAVLE
jgi:hypothetical protein